MVAGEIEDLWVGVTVVGEGTDGRYVVGGGWRVVWVICWQVALEGVML